MTPVPALPMVVVPLAFLFVLLVILVVKAPKVGAWVVGGLVLLAFILLIKLAKGGALAHDAGLALWVVPASFLFVLLVILLAKAPKAAVGLIVAALVLGVVGFFVAIPVSHRRASQAATVETYMPQPIEPGSAESRAMVQQRVETIQEFDRVFEGFVREPSGLVQTLPSRSGPTVSSGPAPIWSEGIEQQFDADVYPSKRAAARMAGSQLAKSIRGLTRDPNCPAHVVIFQEGQDYGLVAELRDAVKQTLPDVACAIEAERRNTTPQEMAVTLRFADLDTHPAPWAESDETKTASGRMDVDVSCADGTTHIPVRFTEKPWVEDFATFANMRPKRAFVVANSNTACLTENEAREQAMHHAGSQLQRLIGRQWKVPGVGELQVKGQDLQEGGFIIDTFLQSFYGSAGRIWRQAILVDASPRKLTWLDARMTGLAQAGRMSWARMGFSVIGVLVLIWAIYFFLNMATMGYYEWSLRIAGVVLAIVAIVSILMIVR